MLSLLLFALFPTVLTFFPEILSRISLIDRIKILVILIITLLFLWVLLEIFVHFLFNRLLIQRILNGKYDEILSKVILNLLNSLKNKDENNRLTKFIDDNFYLIIDENVNLTKPVKRRILFKILEVLSEFGYVKIVRG